MPNFILKRRWFRYSLRTLLIFVTVFCVWLGMQVNAVREQREAVAAINTAGASFAYLHEISPWPDNGVRGPDRSISPPGPAWLRECIGDDYFQSVAAVYFTPPQSNLRKSDFDNLAKLPDLITINIDGSENETSIQDSDLAFLTRLRRLKVLAILNTHVDGSALAFLPNPNNISMLLLTKSDINDGAMKHISKMKMLYELWLDGTRVTDDGLKQLRNLTNLEHIKLSDCAISDAGLQYLKGMNKLSYVELRRTRVTRDGVSELQKSLPNTNIYAPYDP